MSVLASPLFLRNVLRADAASSLGCGALQVAFTGALVPLLGLSPALLLQTGWFMLAYGAAIACLSSRQPLPRTLVWLVVAGNLGWAVACVGLLVSGQVQPTSLGIAYVALQAVTVAVLAELQFSGLRATAQHAAW